MSGLTGHQKVVRQDIKLAARIIQNFDDKWKIWEEPEPEKKDDEKEAPPTVILITFQSGKPGTIRESNQASGVRKAYYMSYYVRKSSILLAGTGIRKISSVACGFSPVKIRFSDYPKSLISRINEVYVFFNIISL